MIDDNWKEKLQRLVNAHCKKHNKKVTMLGVEILNDADFFVDIFATDKGCNVKTLLKVKHWFANQKKKSVKK